MKTFVKVERAQSGGSLNVVHQVEDLAIGGGGQFRITTVCGITAVVVSLNPNGHTAENCAHLNNGGPYTPCDDGCCEC